MLQTFEAYLAVKSKFYTDPRLSAKHPLRIGAMVRLAAIQAAAGDQAAAAASYERTGLDTRQCALLDAQPALLRSNTGSADFPMAAMQWGFEGWVRTEYDVRADGKTAQQRAIIAYPPFVFRSAAIDVAKNFTYSVSYRPDGSAGCGGKQQNINFSLNH